MTKNQPAKLSKAMGQALYSLFGPNGDDVPVHTSQIKLCEAFRELERHGIVSLEVANLFFPNLFNVRRQHRDLKSKSKQKGPRILHAEQSKLTTI